MKEKWLNRIAVVGSIVVLGLWAWWLFRPQPTQLISFALKARWKVKGITLSDIAFSPKGDWLATSVFDFQKGQSVLTVQLWQVSKAQTKPKVLTVRQLQPRSITSRPELDFSPDGRLLAIGYMEQYVGKVDIFTIPDGQRLRTITMGKIKRMPVLPVTFTPDGRLAIIHDFRLWFVRIEDGKKKATNIQAEEVAFSPDGRWMAAVQKNALSLYDANGHLFRQIQLPSPIVWRTTTFSKDGQRLACLWFPRRRKLPFPRPQYNVSVWQTKDGRLVWSAPLTPEISSLYTAFAPDLSMVALFEPDRFKHFVVRLLTRHSPSEPPPTQLVVRRLSDGQVVAKLPRFGHNVGDCAFSPDGRYLAVSHINTISLWERKED